MYKEKFENLIAILQDELIEYTKLRDLFEEKKELLKKSKPDDLGAVDNKITAVNDSITKLNEARKNLAVELTGKDATMTEFIGLAERKEPEIAKKLAEIKVKICKIIEELVLLNNQNVELIKHGIIITNKMLETIIDAFAPQGSNYNGAGKADTHDLDMWTINEQI